MGPGEPDKLARELQPLFDAVADCFAANDFAALRGLWEADAAPFYIAEEHEPPISGWDGLEAYWRATEAINNGYSGRYEVVAAKRLGAGHAVAQFTLRWRILVAGQPEAYGGFNRGQAVVAETAEGWRFAAYAEAPLAPITYLRKLYFRVGRELGEAL